jgi:hypothetical protein
MPPVPACKTFETGRNGNEAARLSWMKRKWPTELGDGLLVAAAITTLALFGLLYATLPPTAVEVQTAGQMEPSREGK